MTPRLKVCTQPGCPELTPTPQCPTHTTRGRATQAARRRANGDDAMDVYSTAAWRSLRARYLRAHPRCDHCRQPARHVDHVAPRKLLVAAGIHNPDATMWLQPLCEPCHNRKTATVDTPLLARLRDGEPAEALATEALSPVDNQGCTP